MEKINFKIQLEEKDAIEFVKLHLFVSKIWFSLFFSVTTVLMWWAAVIRIIQDSSKIGNYILFFIGPGMFVVFYYLMVTSAKGNFKRAEVGKLVMEYTFDEEGISQKSDDYESKIKWEKIHRVFETETLISIYVTKSRAISIPKDKVTPEQLSSLKNLLRSSIANKKCKFK